MPSIECTLCNFNAPSRNLWLSHLRTVHQEDENFSIICGINGCTVTYDKCASFVSHVYRQHRDAIIKQKNEATCMPDLVNVDVQSPEFTICYEGSSSMEESMLEDRTDLEHVVDQLLENDDTEQQKKAALFMLNLKEIRGLSEAAVDHVVKETQKIFRHTIGRIRAGVNECIANGGSDPNTVPNLQQFLSSVEHPFKGLHSTFLQEQFYREKFRCNDPVEIKIGPAYYATKFSGSKRKKVLVRDTFQYIPIEDTLKKVLQMPDVLHEIDEFHGSKDDILRDMCDGSVFKTHPLFKSNSKAIQVIGYYDEVELCNPLGSSTKKHKLGCIFFSIGNLRQRFRSRLKCIFVVAIATNPTIQKHGMNLFLQPFVQSMCKLAIEGLSVSIKGETRHFKVGLLAFLADTLAAHALGGFKESMSFARRICRSCMATTEAIQSNFLETDFEMRTAEMHQSQVLELTGFNYAAKSVEYGINRQSELDKIPNFSVAENLPHDIMHDLFEGVVPYEMKLLLTHLVNAKYFTIAILNDRLRRFDFGYIESSDIPSPLDEKNFMKNPDQKIRQSASKMWLLAITLPLLVGDLVPEGCEVWDLFILLLRICSIACSWQITPDTAFYLSILVEDHHTRFKRLYPNKTIIPKMHYLLHYMKQILKFGPLIYAWTMRHEAKLSVLKRAASHGNFKNICYTVAKRSQHALCYHLNCGEPFLKTNLEVSPRCSYVPFDNEPEDIRTYFHTLGLSIPESVVHPNWIKSDYLNIKKFVCIYLENGEMHPKFGKIVDLFMLQKEKPIYALRIQHYETLYFDSHFCAYAVNLLPSYSILKVSLLPAFPLFHSHKAFGSPVTFIVLKQYIM